MDKPLLPLASLSDILFDLKYEGPSFEGVMEISALKDEISGLDDAIRIAASILLKNKRIDFGPKDLEIYVKAFEKGSFRNGIKVVQKSLKSLSKYDGAIQLGILIVAIIALIQQKGAGEIKKMSPQLMSEIGDQVKIELLNDKDFIKSMSNVVNPLQNPEDQLVCTIPGRGETTITYNDKKEFLELSDEDTEGEQEEGDHEEALMGRINSVDLDARVRHIGFKPNGEGSSIPATLEDDLRSSTSMAGLLGRWVEIKGIVTYQKGLRRHITIQSIKVLKQQDLFEQSAEKLNDNR